MSLRKLPSKLLQDASAGLRADPPYAGLRAELRAELRAGLRAELCAELRAEPPQSFAQSLRTQSFVVAKQALKQRNA